MQSSAAAAIAEIFLNGRWKNETIYILYEDLNRILPVSSWGYADKDELIKLAENIELLPTGNTVSRNFSVVGQKRKIICYLNICDRGFKLYFGGVGRRGQ